MKKKHAVNQKSTEKRERKEERKRIQTEMEAENKEKEKWSVGVKEKNKKLEEKKKRNEKRMKKKEREALEEEETKSFLSFNKNERQYTASGIDQGISLMKLAVTSAEKTAKQFDRHPERRAKIAYKKYEEKHMPVLKKEHQTLRYSQIVQMIEKMWKKAEENPMNQESVPYDEKGIKEKATLLIEERLQNFSSTI